MSSMESDIKTYYTVFWLGAQRPCVEEQKRLSNGDLIKHIFYFDNDDTDKYLKCLQLISKENVLLVIIDTTNNEIVMNEKILTQVHNLYQVKRIYIDAKYCNRHPSQLFPKVKYVSNQRVSLHIQADLHAWARVTESFVFNTFSEQSSLGMNGEFMWSEMMIDHLVCNFSSDDSFDNYSTFAKSKNEFLEVCRNIYRNISTQLAEIEEFEQTYTPDQALNWYTRQSFLYTLLNKAFRTNDTRLFLVFRFFIIDLHQQLFEKSSEPFTERTERGLPSVYCVYRGQLMSKHELDSLRTSLGNIISMKSFLSTSLNREIALMYLGESDDDSQESLIRVLIEINLGNDTSCTHEKPFANISKYSHFGDVEKEVLFMVGSWFRVADIRRGEKGIWYVHLARLGPFDNPLENKWSKLYHHMKNFSHPMLIPHITGTILFQTGKFNEAQTYYERLISHLNTLSYVSEETTDEEEDEQSSYVEHKTQGLLAFLKNLASNVKSRTYFESTKTTHILSCYYVLGRITNEKGLFDQSIIYYKEVLNESQPSFITHEQPRNSVIHILRALCRLGLGVTYELNGQLKRAFESYTKALQMFKQAHNGLIDKVPNFSDFTHMQKAHCLIGFGILDLIEQNYKRADTYYREALLLFDKYLPAGHPDQTRTRQKIANIIQNYRCKPHIALEDYKDCIENYLRVFPSDHVDMARVYTDMVRAYEQLPNGLKTALEYAKKAMDIFEKCLPKEHTDNVTMGIIIERVQRKLS